MPYSSSVSPKQSPSLSDVQRTTSRVPTKKVVATESLYQPSYTPAPFVSSTPNLSLPREIPVDSATQSTRSYRLVYVLIILVLFGLGYIAIRHEVSKKDRLLALSEAGYGYLDQASMHLKRGKYTDAAQSFDRATYAFSQANTLLSSPERWFIEVARFVPGLSLPASGVHIIEAGKLFADAGKPFTTLVQSVAVSKEAYQAGEKISLIDLVRQARDPLRKVQDTLEKANQELAQVTLSDIPEERREKFSVIRNDLPPFLTLLSGFENNETMLEELLGGNGPRTYLFLLQNNHEMRATGGFIGSYALVDINNGVVRRFFVDGIFNPDGQLKENIIPPKPIQKISAAWSLHDSNWFPDFPTSAEKAISFYEKTGGPTVDGVITLTPTIMQRLLAVVGPISLPQYGLTVDADNFIPVIQEQVEVKYDKEENQPKKVLADLSQALLQKVFSLQDRTTTGRIAEALVRGLNEKHILMYMRHEDTEHLIDVAGWSGRLLETPKDYLSVVNSNINGYKTDGVIDESIRHQAEIQSDGSIIDTVTITRTHKGGDTPYDWWNKVNSDYLRVYVPKGSVLLSSTGTTWEFPPAPLDYDKLGFVKDPDVDREETDTTVDQKSGIRISEESGKTVFGGWVYVSPKESVTVEYQYRLPFRIDMNELAQGGAERYSVLFQKQSGSLGSTLTSDISLPEKTRVIWQTEPNLIPYGRDLRGTGTLKTDIFEGIVLGNQ